MVNEQLYKCGKLTRIFGGVFYETITPLALVGSEMIIANWLFFISHPTRSLLRGAHKKTHSAAGTSPRVPRANSLSKLSIRYDYVIICRIMLLNLREHRRILVILHFSSPVESSLRSSWTGGARTRQVGA